MKGVVIYMNKYEKVRLDLENSIRKVRPAENFTEIIDDYAKKGYRFKQLFSPTGKNGTPKFYDIIFEKIEDETVYIYDYLQIEVDHKAKNDLLTSDYWEDVVNYQLKGWDFVTIFAPASLKGGLPKYYELIFEKKTYSPPVEEVIPNYNNYDYQKEYLNNQNTLGHQQNQIEYEKPSEQKIFNLPNGNVGPYSEKPITPYISEKPLVDIKVLDDSLLHKESDVKDVIHELPDLTMNNYPSQKQQADEDEEFIIEETPAFPKKNYEEEKIDRYEKKDDDDSESKPKFIFKDEITNEIIDKDYAKRFFNQINKKEEKVPMKAKPTNVGFVEFDDDDEF